MSQGVTKVQLAISLAKARREELKFMQENCSGGGAWRRYLITRISQLDQEIKQLEGRAVTP